MEWLQKITGWLKQTVEAGLALLCLAVVAQVLFGSGAAFFPVDVVGNVVAITKALGNEGLVGLVAIMVLASIFNRR